MIISLDYPPNIEDIRKAFKLSGNEVFCYGKVIYNPSQKLLTQDLLDHEAVHIAQQADNKEAWWELYLKDPLFRSSQEIPAFQMQYKTAKKYIKDRNRLCDYLRQLATNLSGETYGKCLTFTEAFNAIREEKLFNINNLARK